VVDESGSVTLWDVNSGDVVATLAGHEVQTIDAKADIRVDGQTVLTIGCDEYDAANDSCGLGSVRIWDSASGAEVSSMPYDLIDEPGDKAYELSRDGTRLITGACIDFDEENFECNESQLTIWDTASGEKIISWSAGPGPILWIDYGPDRSRIFTTNGNETRIWDAVSGDPIQTLPGRFQTVNSQGDRLVTLGDNHTATVWDLRTGVRLTTLAGHRDGINSVEFSPDGKRLITSSWDSTARVWNAKTGIEILNLSEHDGQVWGAHFSPDGNSIVTASEDGTALIWPFAEDVLLEMAEPSVQRYSPFLTPAGVGWSIVF
jgi:WD40 repeat protein